MAESKRKFESFVKNKFLANQAPDTYLNVPFNEPVGLKMRCFILESIIKYFLYLRGQFPCPYEQLKLDFERESAEKEDDSATATGAKKPLPLEERKRNEVVKNMEEIFQNLRVVFESTQMTKAVIMFGSTTVSPKETYIVSFDRNSPSQDVAQNGKIPRILMQKLITNSTLNDLKDLSLTSMFLLFQIPRDSNIKWFLPKSGFRIPHRGTKFTVNITSPGDDDNTDYNDDELLWFQAPAIVKGFRIKNDTSLRQSWF